MTLTGKALKEMKDIGRKDGVVLDVGSLFQTKNPQQNKKPHPKPSRSFMRT